MTEPVVGRIEQLTLSAGEEEFIHQRKLTELEINRALGHTFDPITYEHTLEQCRRQQFHSDCMAICWYCANKNYEPAVYDDEAEVFVHTKIDTKKKSRNKSEAIKKEHCDASLLFDQWNQDHKDK